MYEKIVNYWHRSNTISKKHQVHKRLVAGGLHVVREKVVGVVPSYKLCNYYNVPLTRRETGEVMLSIPRVEILAQSSSLSAIERKFHESTLEI